MPWGYQLGIALLWYLALLAWDVKGSTGESTGGERRSSNED